MNFQLTYYQFHLIDDLIVAILLTGCQNIPRFIAMISYFHYYNI